MKDVKTLGIVPDIVTYTSDHFPDFIKYMEQLIKDGLAYADNTPADKVRSYSGDDGCGR